MSIPAEERYAIFCKICDEDRFLTRIDVADYQCAICSTVYSDEDGVFDNFEAADYYQLYKGAKRAGLIPDPEWAEYDKEHPNG